MAELTLKQTTRTTASIMEGQKAVGHIGLMSGGSCAFVNLAHRCGVSFVAHSSTCESAFRELLKVLERKGVEL